MVKLKSGENSAAKEFGLFIGMVVTTTQIVDKSTTEQHQVQIQLNSRLNWLNLKTFKIKSETFVPQNVHVKNSNNKV